MISYITGILSEIDDRYIVVEAGGVGYGINVPQTLIYKLPQVGSMVKIYTHLQVAEDSQKLYGFLSADERSLFRLLIGVSGVGPKAGIGVLSVLTPDELRLAVLSDDEKAISKAQGLGPKTAKKIIIELKDKFNIKDITGASKAVSDGPDISGSREDALQALIALGYSPSDALNAISKLGDINDLSSDDILSLALRQVVK